MTTRTFEWDTEKAAANVTAHGAELDEEAVTVFIDPLARVHDDPDHSLDEKREILIGHSREGRLLLVSFHDRSSRIRIISARTATRRERRDYEEARDRER
jgi:hypothetical protein